MSNVVLTASELRTLTESAATDSSVAADELVADWLYWFDKRGERFLTSAAKFGYSLATLDLPLSLARTMNKSALRALVAELRERLPGCTICIVEEEYEGHTLYKVEVAW